MLIAQCPFEGSALVNPALRQARKLTIQRDIMGMG
jgi:hypothetical protein